MLPSDQSPYMVERETHEFLQKTAGIDVLEVIDSVQGNQYTEFDDQIVASNRTISDRLEQACDIGFFERELSESGDKVYWLTARGLVYQQAIESLGLDDLLRQRRELEREIRTKRERLVEWSKAFETYHEELHRLRPPGFKIVTEQEKRPVSEEFGDDGKSWYQRPSKTHQDPLTTDLPRIKGLTLPGNIDGSITPADLENEQTNHIFKVSSFVTDSRSTKFDDQPDDAND